jgi:hypothetical protein
MSKPDANQRGFNAVKQLTEGASKPLMLSRPKNEHAVALGRLGGKIGGANRAANLTPEQRSAIAKQGADKRWGK